VSGNISEWVKFTNPEGALDTSYNTYGNTGLAANYNSRFVPQKLGSVSPPVSGTSGFFELSNPELYTFSCDPDGSNCIGTGLNPLRFLPDGSFWSNMMSSFPSVFNLGHINLNINPNIFYQVVMRGGHFGGGQLPGVFSSDLSAGPSGYSSNTGFRCAVKL